MPHISIKEAARAAGVHRTTITRAIETGKMSAVRLDNGRRCVDPSELSRAFPSDRPVVHKDSAPAAKQQDAPTVHTMVLEARLNELLHLVRTLEADKEDLRTRLDRSEQDRSSALRLLEDQRKQHQPQRHWWQFFWGLDHRLGQAG